MPAIQKSFSLYLVLVAATLAVIPANLARADEADDGAQDISRVEIGGSGVLIHSGDNYRTGFTGDFVYRFHRNSYIDDASDTSQGNDDFKLTTQFGTAGRTIGSLKADGGVGWLGLGLTAVDANSQRVRYLSPQIGHRTHFNDGKSYVALLANPIGGQQSSDSGMHVARTGLDADLHLALDDKLALDATGGLGILWMNGSGTGRTKNLSAALTWELPKLGESTPYLRAEAGVERSAYPKRSENDPSSETNTAITGKLSAGLAR